MNIEKYTFAMFKLREQIKGIKLDSMWNSSLKNDIYVCVSFWNMFI